MSNMLEVYKKTKKELTVKILHVEEKLNNFPLKSNLNV